MPTRGLASVREIRGRRPLAPPSFNLVAGLAATTLAAGLLLLGMLTTDVPPPSFSIVFFAWAPTGAAVALPIVAARAHRDQDAMLGWFAAGLFVCGLAMVLQVVSLPTVDPAGGLLETGQQSNAALYLLFHLALYAAAGAAAAGVPARGAWVFLASGTGLAVAFAMDAIPLPELLGPSTQDYTDLLIGVEVALAVVGIAALAGWVGRSGSPTSPIRAWIGLALVLSVFELVLNAVAAQRYDPMWWSSLSMRLSTFGLLAVGCIWTVVNDLGRVERYSEVELDLRDREIRGSVAVTDLLLNNAQRLGQCARITEVVRVVEDTLTSLSGVVAASVAQCDGENAGLVTLAGEPRWLPVHERVVSGPLTLWLETPQEVGDVGGGAAALAALPLEVSGDLVGSVVVVSDGPRAWGPADRELLSGVAQQAGQALARVVLAERDRDAALTLQEALAPTAPRALPGLELALRYLPGTRGTTVGGDWADGWALPDGRVALVVGDVVGKGLAAAATMGRLRAAIRALVQVDPTPSVVLDRLDQMESELGSQLVATVLFVVLDPVSGLAQVGRAGHLPMAVAEPGGGVRLIEDGGSAPVGVGDGSRPDVVVQLAPGSTVVLYTDGLVERRERPLGDGLEGLQRTLAAAYAGAEELADALLRLSPREPVDDIALLVGRLTQIGDAPTSHQTHLPVSVR